MGVGEKEAAVVTYQIVVQPVALKMLSSISDRRICEKIRDRIPSNKIGLMQKRGQSLGLQDVYQKVKS